MAEENKSKFRITRLEDRIVPSAFWWVADEPVDDCPDETYDDCTGESCTYDDCTGV